MRFLILLMIVVLLPSSVSRADSIYQIGNSLSWDTQPALRDEFNEWHIYCNKNLQFIYDNPNGHCVGSSRPWTDALINESYDFVIVQPFVGTTLSQDAAIISEWMSMQPDATFVIHPGWTEHFNFPTHYTQDNVDDQMLPSVAYIEDLIAALPSDREILSTRSNDILYSVYQDIQNNVGPYDGLSDIYRDNIHMTFQEGRYLMHNAVRHALGQPLSSDGFNVDSAVATYLNSKITGVPEPAMGALFAAIGLTVIRRRRVCSA